MTKMLTFLGNNDLTLEHFTWATKRDEYISNIEILDRLGDDFLGTLVLYGDGLKLTIISDFEPHTGDAIVEMELEDFKRANFRWSRV